MYGLASHEYRGNHIVHERAERLEAALRSIKQIVDTAAFTNAQSAFNMISKTVENALKD